MPNTPTLAEIVAALKFEHDEQYAMAHNPGVCGTCDILASVPADAELFDVERLARVLRGAPYFYDQFPAEAAARSILAAAKEMP